MHGCLYFKPDPGPCPVDDTPHTACTPESIAPGRRRGSLTVPLPVPRVFTTASYPRAITEAPVGVRIATERTVRMTTTVGALQAGVVYAMRPAQADPLVAQGLAVPVTAPSARGQHDPTPPVREPDVPPPPKPPPSKPAPPTKPPRPAPSDEPPDDDDDDDQPPGARRSRSRRR